MAIVFKTPKSTLNTTSKQIQNVDGNCPPCPEPVLEGKELEYTQNGEYTVTPEQGVDGFSSIDVTVNIPSDVNNQNKSVTITDNGISTVSADSGYSGLGDVTVEVNVVPTMAIAHIDPSTEHQTITPPAIYDGYASIEVNAVTNQIDSNIAAGNIKDGVTILGVTGNYSGSAINNQNKTVSPSTSQQSVSADQGYTGLGTVTVNAVTAAIDANIVAENILDGVTILGVTGSDLGYDVGYSDGYAQGQAECPEPGCNNTAYVQETITTSGTYTYDPSDYQGESYDAFDGVEITVNVPSGGTNVPDWSSIGFTNNDVQGIVDAVDYSADIKSQYIDNNQVVPENIWYKMTYWPSGMYSKYNTSPYMSTSTPQIMKDVIWYWNRGSSWNTVSFFGGMTALLKIGSVSFVDRNYNTIKPQNMYNCFYNCKALKEAPAIDTSEATSVEGMFNSCTSLTRINGSLDLSSATTMSEMFYGCESLQTFPQITNTSGITSLYSCFGRTICENYPLFDTSSVTDANYMFTQAHSMNSINHPAANIPAYDFSSVTTVDNMFGTNAFYYNTADTPVTFGGFTNLGKAFIGIDSYQHTLDLSRIGEAGQTIVIPKQSLMNIINALSAPDDATCTDATLKLSAKQYGMLDASDIAIATAKNWSVISA